jgi:hypothetical protein
VAINLCLIWFVKYYYTNANWDLEDEYLIVNDKNIWICEMDIDGEIESLVLNIRNCSNAYDIIYVLHRSSSEKLKKFFYFMIFVWFYIAFITFSRVEHKREGKI